MIGLAGFLRGSAGTALSFGLDAYEALTNSPSFRTTVSRSPKEPKITQPTPKEAIGSVIAQLPPIRSATDLVGAADSAYKLGFAQRKSQQDIKELFRILPFQNSFPMIRLSEMMAEKSGLPKKVRESQQNTNKGWW
jgi:hypothetical protein